MMLELQTCAKCSAYCAWSAPFHSQQKTFATKRYINLCFGLPSAHTETKLIYRQSFCATFSQSRRTKSCSASIQRTNRRASQATSTTTRCQKILSAQRLLRWLCTSTRQNGKACLSSCELVKVWFWSPINGSLTEMPLDSTERAED